MGVGVGVGVGMGAVFILISGVPVSGFYLQICCYMTMLIQGTSD